jgi:predicted transposase/invertase (TIGR01784 family)
MQVSVLAGLVQRIVFYGCELYAGQLLQGDRWTELNPVYSICLLDGILWRDAAQVHHTFRLTDQKSGRVLAGTLEIHMLELGRYNKGESDLASASLFDCWLFWFLHAHEYGPETLLKLLPQQAIQQATRTIARIAEITEDKAMYDARQLAIRDRETALHSAYQEGVNEGEIKGEIKLIRALQGILGLPVTEERELQAMTLAQLAAITSGLQANLRTR